MRELHSILSILIIAIMYRCILSTSKQQFVVVFFFILFRSTHSVVARALDFPLSHSAWGGQQCTLSASASLDNDEGESNEIIIYNKMRIFTLVHRYSSSCCLALLDFCDNKQQSSAPQPTRETISATATAQYWKSISLNPSYMTIAWHGQ